VIYLLTILTLIPAQSDRLTSINDYLYEIINGLAGRSWIFDSLMDLPLENNLIKAVLMGACFMFVWFGGKDEADIIRRRRVLLITLLALIFVIATTKTISKSIFLPRPFIQSQKTFHLEEDQLVESTRLNYRVPLDEENQKNFKALERGEIIQNDLGSFPSDHAGFYMTFAVGILLACRSIGMIALAWTLLITLGSRVITGQHSPLDIAAGSGIGIGILLLLQFVIGKWGRRFIDPVANWTLNHSAFASAIIFILIFEATNTLENVRPLVKLGKDIIKHSIGG
jgi:membrane-associated phospholipid phosphatase